MNETELSDNQGIENYYYQKKGPPSGYLVHFLR
jgi:hypothetical protein